MFQLFQFLWTPKKKEVIFSKPFYPTENIDKDFAHLRKFYSGVVGIVPKNS